MAKNEIGCRPEGKFIVHKYAHIIINDVAFPINEYAGHIQSDRFLRMPAFFLDRCQDDAVHPLGLQRLEDVLLDLPGGIRVTQHDRITIGLQWNLQAPDQIREKRIGDIGNHQSDGLGVGSCHATGHQIGRVAIFLDNALNPLSGLLADSLCLSVDYT